jgi:Meckel syndrome type 1 protein
MNPKGPLVAVVCLAAVMAAVSATGAESDKADPAEAAAAMERAQRLATNPMRIILQASKIRRKVPAEADTADLPAEAGARADPSTSARATPPARGGAGAAAIVLTADRLPAAAAASPVPALEREGVAAALSPLPGKSVALAEVAAAVTPKLAQMVEPTIPARLREELGASYEVMADLTIRADGSVAEVKLLPPTPRQVQRQVLSALQQWRFEPLPAARVHRVQLVFTEGS